MKGKIHVGCSPLTGTIYAGKVLKDGQTWASDRQDVSIEALVAVAQHGVHFGKPIEIISNGKLEYRITVEKFEGAEG